MSSYSIKNDSKKICWANFVIYAKDYTIASVSVLEKSSTTIRRYWLRYELGYTVRNTKDTSWFIIEREIDVIIYSSSTSEFLFSPLIEQETLSCLGTPILKIKNWRL